jgi:GNAT superfamily N-acetyltransferase
VQQFVDAALIRHTAYPGYRCVVATDPADHVLGFVYGYESAPGRWWHDAVSPVMRERGHAGWLQDAFEFVEFAVVPEFQGVGIGSQLHDRILSQTDCASALLSTHAGPNPAHAMYVRRGWVDLVPQFVYPGGGRAAILMGLDLVAWRREHGRGLQ